MWQRSTDRGENGLFPKYILYDKSFVFIGVFLFVCAASFFKEKDHRNMFFGIYGAEYNRYIENEYFSR